MVDGHLGGELLGDYAEGLLDPAARREAEVHLQACADCRRELEAVQGYFRDMAGLDTFKAPDRFLTRVHGRIAKTSPWKRILAALSSPRLLPVPLAALSVVLLGVYLAFMSRDLTRSDPKRSDLKRSDPVAAAPEPSDPAPLASKVPAARDLAAPPAASPVASVPAAPSASEERLARIPAPGKAKGAPEPARRLSGRRPPVASAAEEMPAGAVSRRSLEDEAILEGDAAKERGAKRPASANRAGIEAAESPSSGAGLAARDPASGPLSKAGKAEAPPPPSSLAQSVVPRKPWAPLGYALQWTAPRSGVAGFRPGLAELGVRVIRHEEIRPGPAGREGADAAVSEERYELQVPAARIIELETFLGHFGILTSSAKPLPGKKGGEPILMTVIVTRSR